jgi:hypothetical protein
MDAWQFSAGVRLHRQNLCSVPLDIDDKRLGAVQTGVRRLVDVLIRVGQQTDANRHIRPSIKRIITDLSTTKSANRTASVVSLDRLTPPRAPPWTASSGDTRPSLSALHRRAKDNEMDERLHS